MIEVVDSLFAIFFVVIMLIAILAALAGLFSLSRWLFRCVREENCSRDINEAASDYPY